jgi:hypothetical protein
VRQVGENLEVSWSYKGPRPKSQQLQLLKDKAIVKSLKLKSGSLAVRLEKVAMGRYTVVLKTANSSLRVQRSVDVYGKPLMVTNLKAEQLEGKVRMEWVLDQIEPLRKATDVVIDISRSGITESVTIPASTILHEINVDDERERIEISVKARNIAGTSSTATTSLDVEPAVDKLTAARLVTLQDAEKLFGSFAIVNRSPLGPVDLTDPTQAMLNPVLSSLRLCVLETIEDTSTLYKDVAIQNGLTNIGGVWATRNSTGTLILTSGALSLAEGDGTSWLSKNSGLGPCAEPSLQAQLNYVSKQLSPNSKIVSVETGPLLIDSRPGVRSMQVNAKVLVNGGVSGEVEQDLQLIWVVVGKDSTITQYILLRQGAPLDEAMTNELMEITSQRNQIP